MTVNDLIKILNGTPCVAKIYASDPEGWLWLFEVKNVVVRYDEKLNQTWVEFRLNRD